MGDMKSLDGPNPSNIFSRTLQKFYIIIIFNMNILIRNWIFNLLANLLLIKRDNQKIILYIKS